MKVFQICSHLIYGQIYFYCLKIIILQQFKMPNICYLHIFSKYSIQQIHSVIPCVILCVIPCEIQSDMNSSHWNYVPLVTCLQQYIKELLTKQLC